MYNKSFNSLNIETFKVQIVTENLIKSMIAFLSSTSLSSKMKIITILYNRLLITYIYVVLKF
jgi:hypothetical protein